jgi:hypothetical protein
MLIIVTLSQKPHTCMNHQNTAPIFSAEFNRFQKINATEAWSLFFSASNKDQLLGSDRQTGNYFTFALLGAVISYALEIVVSHSI